MTQSVNDRIIALMNPEFLERIPQSAKEHALTASCTYIEREYPELYRAAGEEVFSDSTKEELGKVIHQLFEERMAKHHF